MSDFIEYKFHNNSIIDIHSNTKYSLLQLLTLLSFDPVFFVYLDNKTNDCDNDTYRFYILEKSNKTIKYVMKRLKRLIEDTKNITQYIQHQEFKKYILWFCDHELNSLNDIIDVIKNNPDVNHYYIKDKAFILGEKIPFLDSYLNCLITHDSNPYWNEYKKINEPIHIDYLELLNENEFVRQLIESMIIVVAKIAIRINNDLSINRNGIFYLHEALRKRQIEIFEISKFMP